MVLHCRSSSFRSERFPFAREGEGVPLVLVMGTGADHTSWARQIPVLARRLSRDRAGQPRVGPERASAGPPARRRISFARGVRRASPTRSASATFHVAGYSFGAAIAMELALLAPDRIARGLVPRRMGGPESRDDDGARGARSRSQHERRRGVPRGGLPPEHEPGIPEQPAFPALPAERPPERRCLRARGHHRADQRGLCRTTSARRLPALRVRALVTTGEHDPVAPPSVAEELASLIPGARLHIFRGPRAWHAIPLEMSDEFNTLLLRLPLGPVAAPGRPDWPTSALLEARGGIAIRPRTPIRPPARRRASPTG